MTTRGDSARRPNIPFSTWGLSTSIMAIGTPGPHSNPSRTRHLCLAVSNGQLGEVNAQIEAGVDVNDTCQTTTLWYNGLTPLAIAMERGRTEIETILVEAGAVDAES